MLLVPLRVKVMTKWFSAHDLYYLDQLEGESPPVDEGTDTVVDGTVAAMAETEADLDTADVLEAAGLAMGRNARPTAPQRTATRDFRKLDADGDGVVTFEEFKAWRESQQ